MKTFFTKFLFLSFVSLLFCNLFTDAQRQMEYLNRHVVAVRTSSSQVFVSWTMLGTEYAQGATYNLYRGSTRIASNLSTTNYSDNTSSNSTYSVSAVIGGSEQSRSATAGVMSNNYISVPLSPPSNHHANDCSVGDLDGDGDYEIVLKWEANDSKDNSQSGVTDVVYLEGLELNGTRLWRINLGINIRAGAHYTQFMVYDLDGDGKAEVACKTAPGTRSGTGSYLSNGPAANDNDNADYRNSSGYILTGPEYLTIFNGQTGAEMVTTNYVPARGNVSDWGDSYGNRVDRFLACIAYLDGSRPSLVMCRGYYTRTVLAAWDFRNSNLTQRWVFDSNNSGYSSYAGQGNHNLSVADVDNDGRDEIVYGSMCVNDNGAGLWNSGLGHGDAMHVSDINTSRSGLEVWGIHEGTGTPGSALLDARTGAVLWQTSNADVGRGVAADLTSSAGMECWGGTSGLRTSTNGSAGSSPASSNHLIWWDGDEYRELLDNISITKYGGGTLLSASGCASNNGTKANPCLTADIMGDWREEAIWRTSDNTSLRIYTTTNTTSRRMYSLMHDPQYRLSIAWQNVAYNQPPHTGFFFGNGMSNPPNPNITLIGGGGGGSCDPTSLTPYVQINGGSWNQTTSVSLSAGDDLMFGPQPSSGGSWSWTGPNGFSASTREVTVNNIQTSQAGNYIATFINECGTESNLSFNVSVSGGGGGGTTITIQENQTGFCGVDGSVDNNNSGFTGDGFANTNNATGNGVDYKVTFSASGSYTFTFRYASSSDRPGRLYINGSTAISSISFPSTGSWTTWTTVSASASVSAGTFDVRLEATGSNGLGNIDYMQVTGTTPSPADCNGTPANNPPSVSVTSPSNGASYTAGANITINAGASDNDGSISLVEFYRGSTKLGEDASSPYSYTWSNVPEGNYSLTARATDDDGATTTSQAVNISVNAASCNPTSTTPYLRVNGGSWQQTSSVTLNVGDDVQFGPQPVSGGSWNWSGPNGFSASTREVTVTNIQSNQAGTYVATYTNDCGAQTNQNFSVTVNGGGGGTPVTLTIQENTNGFCSVDGTVDNNNSGFTGSGFANTDNSSGMGITWSLSVPSGGSYSLVWRYANGTTTNRTGQVMVDGSVVVSSVGFSGTGSWTTWTSTSGTNVNLSTGTRLIRLQATNSSGLANIDYLSVTGIDPQPVSCAGQKSTAEKMLTEHTGSYLEVYPNPLSGDVLELNISIALNSDVSLKVFNSSGDMVYTEDMGQLEAGKIHHSIDAGFFTSGIYVILMQVDGTYITTTFVRQ